MDERRQLAQELDEIQQLVKELEIHYEQYFAGIERREPYNKRKDIVRRIRHFTNRHIVWTDLKFRYQSIASRFMSYGQYWDRILRLIDEGKYHRHTAKLNATAPLVRPDRTTTIDPIAEADKLQQELSQARKTCGLSGEGPSAEKVANYLANQREKIRARYGDKPVFVDIEPITYTLNPSLLRSAITRQTKAIIASNLFGQAVARSKPHNYCLSPLCLEPPADSSPLATTATEKT